MSWPFECFVNYPELLSPMLFVAIFIFFSFFSFSFSFSLFYALSPHVWCFILFLLLSNIPKSYMKYIFDLRRTRRKGKKFLAYKKTIDVMSIFNLFSSRQNFKQARKKRRFPHINILFWLVMRVGEMKKITATITTVSFCLLHTSGSATQKHSSPNSKQATLHIQNTNTLTHVSISLSHSLCLSKCA